jgi:hypothetical protein
MRRVTVFLQRGTAGKFGELSAVIRLKYYCSVLIVRRDLGTGVVSVDVSRSYRSFCSTTAGGGGGDVLRRPA